MKKPRISSTSSSGSTAGNLKSKVPTAQSHFRDLHTINKEKLKTAK